MTFRPARSAAAVAAACLLVAASGGAAAHAAALFDSRELGVDAGGTVEVGITFHNVERAEFRLEGADGFRLTGSVRNPDGGVGATLTLDAGAAGRGDTGAALRVSGGTLRNPTVENAPDGPLPPGEYGMSLFARGLTVDRGTLTVSGEATVGATTDAPGTVGTAGADAPADASPDAPRTDAPDPESSDRGGGRATSTGGTTAAAPGFGAVAAALGGLLVLLAVGGVAGGRRR